MGVTHDRRCEVGVTDDCMDKVGITDDCRDEEKEIVVKGKGIC